jgi:hypothetical protein
MEQGRVYNESGGSVMIRPGLKYVILAVVVGLFSLWLEPAAHSQQPQNPASKQGTNQQVSDQELTAFAKAYVEYQKVRQHYESSLNNAKDSAERERIQQEGTQKAKEAVEKQGLSVESYKRIFSTVNGNEELRKKALNLIKEERKKTS